MTPSRADVCIIAIAECFRGDGEILANPIGNIPMIGGRLARATFEPDLMMTDGEAALIANDTADTPAEQRIYEFWNPYRSMFDVMWSGRRHVIMGASQVDRFGNQNIAAIGDYRQPKAMLLGYRGAPGNTINHTTSYWVPRHNPKTMVAAVDTVTGIGWDRAAELGEGASRYFEVRRVVSDLGVFDFETPDHSMRLRSIHPGVELDEIVSATGFELVIPDRIDETRRPTDDEIRLIHDVIDPHDARSREVPQR